jgi:ABC-type branched-subunit amino acid transport system substrate-binding protein
MDINIGRRRAEGLSILSVLLTIVAITINHWYRLGAGALVLGGGLSVLSAGSWAWFRRTQHPIGLVGYLLVNAWIVVGFGLYKGLARTVVPLLAGRGSGPLIMEASGVLTFVGSLFVLHTAARFAGNERDAAKAHDRRSTWVPSSRTARRASTLAAMLLAATGSWIERPAFAQTTTLQHAVDAEGPIKIGVIATTRGPAGLLGASFLKSIQLAKEETDDTRRRYALVVEQIPSPDQAEPAIKRLVEGQKVDALIVAMSMSGEIIKPYAAAAKIPMFCICSIGSLGDELYTFTTMPLAEDEASLWVAEAQRRGIKRVARFTQDFPSIDNHVRAIKLEAAKAGITFVYENRFNPATMDFRAEIEAAKATAPDVYYVEGFNPTLDILGRQLRDAGVANMASVVAFSISDAPGVFENGWYTDSYVSPAFRVRLERRYPGVRLATHMMPYAYDSYRMLVDAFESGDDVLSYIRQMTTFTGTAGTITKPAGTGNFRSAPAVWVIVDGKPALLTSKP